MESIRKLIDSTFGIESEAAMEAAGYSKEYKYPVFILLTLGHTALSGIITKATGDEFSHASISFTPSLSPMYSFGTKKLDTTRRELGFVQTTPTSSVWRSKDNKYNLYVTFVNKENYDKMQQRLQYFLKNRDSLKYDFPGLVRIFFKMKSSGQRKWFCSRFVAEILSQGKNLDKDPSLYRPDTLKGIGNTCLMMKGNSIQKFDAALAKKAFEKVKSAPEGTKSVVDADKVENED